LFSKTFLYAFLIGLVGIAGVILIINAFLKSHKKRFIPGKLSLLFGIILLLISAFAGINLGEKLYTKIKTTVTALQNFPETVGTEVNTDTSNYIKILKTYEPEKYKGKVPDEYYYYYSLRDGLRYPLVYPYSNYSNYSNYSTDVLETAAIVCDTNENNFSNNAPLNLITKPFFTFIFDKNYLIGSLLPDTNKTDVMIKTLPEYFIFDFRNGKSETIMGETTMKKKLDEINFTGDRKFITFQEYGEKF